MGTTALRPAIRRPGVRGLGRGDLSTGRGRARPGPAGIRGGGRGGPPGGPGRLEPGPFPFSFPFGGPGAGGAPGGGDGAPVAQLTDESAWVKVGPTSGPSTGWSDGGLTVDASTLKCTQPAADPTRGVTDTEITVEGLAYLTSPGGSTMQGADVGAKVRFDAANDAGGVNGRRINFTGVLDDGQDSSRNIAQAKVIATQTRAFAAVPVITSQAGYADTFCQEKVPFFGWGTNEGFCETAVGFGITGCQYNDGVLANNLAGMVNSLFEDDRNHTLALVGIDLDSSRAALGNLKKYAEAGGVKVTYAESPIPASGLADTTALVQAVMSSNAGAPPDVVYFITDFASGQKLVQALKAAGYPGKFLSPFYDPALVGLKDFDGMYATSSWLPGIDDTNVKATKMVADFKKYAPDQRISISALAGYWSADLFVDALSAAGRDLTVDTFVDFLNKDWVHGGEGAVPETRWPLNHFATTPCSSISQLKDGAWHPVTELSCGSLLVRK
ncbi:ABC transporter substrate-binding protein [Frankia nepalensis]|uniref:ABC transporter substrate-binding protein n=3 Tax=Frankia nepalensis TaxID=1836974 RepID=UPI002551F6DD|nr:ABC transporter substrate-binding protein [Frankia nepalensis]